MDDSLKSDDAVARHWDENANTWADHVRRGWDAYREHFNNPAFFEFIGDLNGKTVLDAGCGEGYNTRLLAKRGAKIVGVDISRKMIELARAEEECEPLGISYEVSSYSSLSQFGDASFDAVISFMALMDGPDYEGAVREFFRVLRPGGELNFNIVHPCFITRGAGWVRDEQGVRIKLTVAEYFNEEPYVSKWTFSKGPIPEDTPPFVVPYFPRTLSAIVNTLIDEGFTLAKMAEPRPTEEACKEHPWLERYRKHAAPFIYIKAAKPVESKRNR